MAAPLEAPPEAVGDGAEHQNDSYYEEGQRCEHRTTRHHPLQNQFKFLHTRQCIVAPQLWG